MSNIKTIKNKGPYLRLALPLPLRRFFDYLPAPEMDCSQLRPGIRVRVPFQSRSLVGVLVSLENETDVPVEKLKTASEILDDVPVLTPEVMSLCLWAADYYHYAVGDILASAMPALLRRGKPPMVKHKKPESAEPRELPLSLNEEQARALAAIVKAKNTFKVFLLDGVTGSGKTEVYLQAIADILNDGKQVLVLVPEISLTPQTIARFRGRFTVPMETLHSNLSEQARLRAWLAAKSGEARIIIGTRSAVFTPFANLGLIIVDEEHDVSFKQQERFRYHARDLAILRANKNGLPIVLGSATPSLESLFNAMCKRYELLVLPERAGCARLPQFQLVDLRSTTIEEGLSSELLQAMRTHLDAGNQVMLFLNRRGYAPVLYCTQCAFVCVCRRCDARMVYHQSPKRLQCHHCDAQNEVPKACVQCGQAALFPVGLGTQRLAQTLAKHFACVPILRFDRDTTRRKEALTDLLAQVHTQQKMILLGTQMLAKGHHFPHVTLVAIIDADSGLFSTDFRAAEQMGQLLMQVAGRAGRAEKPGTVLLQTRHPQHPLLTTLIQSGYSPFSKMMLAERELAILPPFSYFAVLRAEAYAEQQASQFLSAIKAMLAKSQTALAALTMLGPVPALLAKRKGLYCQHLLLKTPQRSALQNVLKQLMHYLETTGPYHSVKWVLDVDPVEV